MTAKRTATIVVVGGALAAWLAAAATSGNRERIPPIVERVRPVDLRGDVLAGEIKRLHERLRPNVLPSQPGRNLFTFTAPRAEPAPLVVAPVPVPEAAPAPPAFLPPPLKLVGLAEDAGPAGPVRTAIISAPGQLFLVKEGDVIPPRYRVLKVSPEVVELVDEQLGTPLRLALR